MATWRANSIGDFNPETNALTAIDISGFISDDNKYHGFVSEFLNGCKLGSWGSNSYVNHVVADSPLGPWTQAGVR